MNSVIIINFPRRINF